MVAFKNATTEEENISSPILPNSTSQIWILVYNFIKWQKKQFCVFPKQLFKRYWSNSQ